MNANVTSLAVSVLETSCIVFLTQVEVHQTRGDLFIAAGLAGRFVGAYIQIWRVPNPGDRAPASPSRLLAAFVNKLPTYHIGLPTLSGVQDLVWVLGWSIFGLAIGYFPTKALIGAYINV